MPETAVATESTSRPVEVPAAPPAIERILAAIECDSQQAPENYLADSVVPHGGE
jgi:hypothetical protein